ncbi:MAG: N-acetylmuramoyl-L-alanine amidase [Hyphomicrobiaceae bacterium]
MPAAGAAVVTNVSLGGDGKRTTVSVALSRGVRAEVFTLAAPYRVVIDLPAVGFRFGAGTGSEGRGLVTAFRYGLFSDERGRVVLDAGGPVRIENPRMSAAGGDAVVLTIELVPIGAAEFGRGTGTGVASATPRGTVHEGPAPGVRASGRPVVLIDPGHGGIDPGALGASNLMEKTVALSVAQKVRRRLESTGRYDVHMTRTGDVFVPLDKRLAMSRDLGADLFISLHADSIASRTYAPVVRGATVYTLSERASDEQARLMAEKENASDLIAGLSEAAGDDNDEVRGILIDLMKRETANFSADFSQTLVNELGRSISMSRDPRRSAAFKVLKQTHAPSVLVELGFMSNAADEELMKQAEWQGKVAGSVVAAVEAFFKRRLANGP